jgi:CRISPR-associated protein Cmr2
MPNDPLKTMNDLWKRKLLAYLHDPPSKCLDLGGHTGNAATLMHAAGFTEEEVNAYNRPADHTASSADRLPFPNSRSSGLSCTFDGVRAQFHHPLGGGELSFHREFATADLAFETDQTIQPVCNVNALPADEQWRARFFAHWRLYPRNARERDYRFAFLPADTRIPDHTVWTHMQVVSALAGCATGEAKDAALAPAFLKFQIGPVQEFIAQARSIRDLWSGSYLLSWLMAAGLKALSAEVGPDAVVFPNLAGQPLFDLHWRDDLWKRMSLGKGTGWDSLGLENEDLLTPNLPNVFLAIVPGQQATELGQRVIAAVRAEWRRIAEAVWKTCDAAGLFPDSEAGLSKKARRSRYEAQVERLWSLAFQATLWPVTLGEAVAVVEQFKPEMPVAKARAQIAHVVRFAEQQMPAEHRDRRFYADEGKTKLNNLGLGWSLLVALNAWELDAIRQNRNFSAWTEGGWSVGTFSNKDSLNGRDEAVAGGRAWTERAEKLGAPWKSLFKKDDWLGAATLIKRVWHLAYLRDEWGLSTTSPHFRIPNTRGLAGHTPFDEGEEEDVEATADSEKYFAVLAFDGDEIGKWVSGEKAPPLEAQLADYRDGSGNSGFGSKPYFARHGADLLKHPRLLSPSYHLQFSEALAKFALECVRPIVEAHDGRLIFAGGDDVMALLPADAVLACARTLSLAFTGDQGILETLRETAGQLVRSNQGAKRNPPYYQKLATEGVLLDAAKPGFLRRLDKVDSQNNRPIPFLVPGPNASASVGIAIAHFKSPLQDVVRAAQTAEKRAKSDIEKGGLGRSAVAVTLMKRSGEILEWGCRWSSGGLELLGAIQNGLACDALSAKFPHRVIELLEPYLTQQTALARTKPDEQFNSRVDEIIRQEVSTALKRQRGKQWTDSLPEQMEQRLTVYLQKLPDPQRKLSDLIGLMQTAAFANRTRSESDSNNQQKGTA